MYSYYCFKLISNIHISHTHHKSKALLSNLSHVRLLEARDAKYLTEKAQ